MRVPINDGDTATLKMATGRRPCGSISFPQHPRSVTTATETPWEGRQGAHRYGK